MKKFMIILFSLLFVWWLCHADLAWFTIDSYTSDFKLRKDWILEVVENIEVNFSESRHWIYRTIPYIYSNYLKTPIKKVKVPWYKFTTNKEWNNYMIKIWSAKKTIIWKQIYTIQYQIKWSVREFSGYQELYRNMLWTEWNTPVNNFNFNLELPSNLNLKNDDIWVYIWSNWSNNTTKAIKSWNIISNDKPLNLWAWEGVTLAVKLPVNYVPTKKYISLKWRFKYYGKQIWFGIRCITTFSILFFAIHELIKRYKNRLKLRQTHWRKIRNMVYYTPPKWYTAMEIASIYNWKSNFGVFSAFLYNWIADGYVRIEEVKIKKFLWLRRKKQYHFRVKKFDHKFKFDEKLNVWNYLYFTNPEERFWELCFLKNDINDLNSFGVSESNLLKKIADETFYQIHTKFIPCWKDLYKVQNLSSDTYKCSNEKIYHKVHSHNNHWKLILNRFIVILWTFISCYLIGVFTNDEDLFLYLTMWFRWIAMLYAIGLIIWNKINKWFSLRWNIKRDIKYISEEWIDAIEQTLWFRKYLLSVDYERLKTLLNEDPTYFEKNLPYAIALWVWNHWIKKCMGILEEIDYKPKWIYVSDDNWWNAIMSDLNIWNHISTTVYNIDHPSSSWWGGWDWGSSSGWWSSGWGSSWWWGGWGWWWSW